CSRFQLDVIVAISAIRTLEANDYLVLSENALLPSRVQFLAGGEDLYRSQVENYKYDFLIKSMLRIYGGVFDGFVAIKESEIAKRTTFSTKEVTEMLRELYKLEVITYVEKTDQPLLTFIQPRYALENLYIDAVYYQQ